MQDDRTGEILEAVIHDYIVTGEPVSSDGLFKRYDFGVKPATIRNELATLTKGGYLLQPHTSGGRVPTNKGYEFYVNRRLEARAARSRKTIARFIDKLEEELHRDMLSDFVADFANRLGVLGVGYDSHASSVYKSGLQDLMIELRHRHVDELFEIVGDFESMDQKLGGLSGHMKGEPAVFIGQSPITKSAHLSVIADKYDVDGKEVILVAIGPRRMDYERNILFFKQLRDHIRS
jgi:transcriptional regulator of heat shock response